jgi:hypothetical protein
MASGDPSWPLARGGKEEILATGLAGRLGVLRLLLRRVPTKASKIAFCVDADISGKGALAPSRSPFSSIRSESRLYAIRLFVHLPEDQPALRTSIEKFFKTKLPEFPFFP